MHILLRKAGQHPWPKTNFYYALSLNGCRYTDVLYLRGSFGSPENRKHPNSRVKAEEGDEVTTPKYGVGMDGTEKCYNGDEGVGAEQSSTEKTVWSRRA